MGAIRRAAALGVGFALVGAAAAGAQERRYTYVPMGGFGNNAYAGSHAYDINESGQVVGFSGSNALGHEYGFIWDDGRMATLGALYGRGSTQAGAINDAGDIVGSADIRSSESHYPMLYRDGQILPLGTGYGAGSWGVANAINNDGVIVGDRRSGQGATERGFVWRDGVYQDLGTLGGVSTGLYGTTTTAEDINDRGQIVGASRPSGNRALQAYIYDDGRMRELRGLGDDSEASQAFAINERGQVAGSSFAPWKVTEAVLWEPDGTIRQLGALGLDGATPRDINENGQVVGYSNIGPYPSPLHAFLWEDGAIYDLHDLVHNLPDNVVLRTARAINDSGVIVGEAEGGARDHGYLLIPDGMPVPTPAPMLLDISRNARPVTVAGAPPTTDNGRWDHGLRFNGDGRVQTPRFAVPLQHRLAAWVRPNADVTGEQVIIDAGGARLVYDGTYRRMNFYVTDATGRTAAAASLPGTIDPSSGKTPFVMGGVRQSGEVVVSIDGRVFSSRQFAGSISAGDASTPISIGATAAGGQGFRGVIETPWISSLPAPDQNFRLGWWDWSPLDTDLFLFHDPDQIPRDRSTFDFPPSPPAPTPGPNDGNTPAPNATPSPTPTPTPSPTPTPTPSPTPTPTPSPTPTPTPSPTPTPTPSPTPTPTPSPTPTPTPSPVPTPTPSPVPTPTPSPVPTPTPTPPALAPPPPAISAPGNYSWSAAATFAVSGTAQPGATVEIFEGSISFGTTSVSITGTWSRVITVPADGAYLFTARARNAGGTSANSSMRVVQVDTRAPSAPALTAPTGTAATSFTLDGNAEAGTTVEVFENGSSRGTIAASGGNWTKAFSDVARGTRSYTAVAIDMAGNRSATSQARTLTIG